MYFYYFYLKTLVVDLDDYYKTDLQAWDATHCKLMDQLFTKIYSIYIYILALTRIAVRALVDNPSRIVVFESFVPSPLISLPISCQPAVLLYYQ